MRVLCNKEKVGANVGFSVSGKEDYFLDSDCDSSFLEITEKCGWVPDMMKYVDQMSEES